MVALTKFEGFICARKRPNAFLIFQTSFNEFFQRVCTQLSSYDDRKIFSYTVKNLNLMEIAIMAHDQNDNSGFSLTDLPNV